MPAFWKREVSGGLLDVETSSEVVYAVFFGRRSANLTGRGQPTAFESEPTWAPCLIDRGGSYHIDKPLDLAPGSRDMV